MEDLTAYKAGKEVCACLDAQPIPKDEMLNAVRRLVAEVKGQGNASPQQTSASQQSSSPPLAHIPNIMLLSPRGQHAVSFHKDSLIVSSAKGTEIRVPTSAVQAVVILDNIPKDQKGKVLMFLSLQKDANITSGKQRLEALVIQTSADAQLSIPVQGSDTAEGPAAIVLCQLLGMAGITSFISPDAETYTNSKGELAVPAVFKVNDGFLFPLPNGSLCFVERPSMYLPYHNIRYASFARVGGTSATFDLQVHMRTGETIEFSQIAQGEQGRLHSYLSKMRIKTSAEEAAAAEAKAAAAREKAVASGAGPSGVNTAAAQAAEDDEDSSDEDDDDFDPTEEEDGGKASKRSRAAKRKRDSGGAGPSTSKAAESEEDLGEEDEEEEEEEDEDEDDDDSEDIEVEDEDQITAAEIQQHMARERRTGKRGQQLQGRMEAEQQGGKYDDDDDDDE